METPEIKSGVKRLLPNHCIINHKMKTIQFKTLAFLFIVAAVFTSCNNSSKINNPENTTQQLVAARPESVGFSSERLTRIDSVVNNYIDRDCFPGAVAFIARHGKIVYYKSFGMRDPETKDPMEKDDIFRIASMTKALASVATMMLYEEGYFLLDDPISKFIPEFKNPQVLVKLNPDLTYVSRPASKEITIRHLLTHTSGIGYPFIDSDVSALYKKNNIPDGFLITNTVLKDAIPALGKMPLLHDPGEKFTYGLNCDVLGYLVEVISGKTFDEFLREELFGPLGMEDACFYLPDEKAGRLVPVYANTDKGLKRSDEEGYEYPVKGAKSYFSGGAGVSCTILDYAKFMQMMINGGSYNGHQILGRKTIDLMTMNQLGNLYGDGGFGLGFGLVTEATKNIISSSVGNYSWGGYFSTTYWMDPKEDLIGLFFTQMAPMAYWDIHSKFQVLTYQALIGE
jgi:CubicO group peptidase (beta-lactamase class C family)